MASSTGFLQSTEKDTVFLDLRPTFLAVFFYACAETREGLAYVSNEGDVKQTA